MTERADIEGGVDAEEYILDSLPSETQPDILDSIIDVFDEVEANEFDDDQNVQPGPTESLVKVGQEFATSNKVPSASRGPIPFSCPLVRRRSVPKKNRQSEGKRLLSVFKMSIIQEQKEWKEDREVQRIQGVEDWRLRKEKRSGDRARREEERARRKLESKRHTQFMETMIFMMKSLPKAGWGAILSL